MANVWGVDEVALAIISHRHGDHYGGMSELASRIPIRWFDAAPLRRSRAQTPLRS